MALQILGNVILMLSILKRKCLMSLLQIFLFVPPDSGTVTSTFTSDLMVNWTINPSSAVSATSTRTLNGFGCF